jgi:hypothetical protein
MTTFRQDLTEIPGGGDLYLESCISILQHTSAGREQKKHHAGAKAGEKKGPAANGGA